MITKFSISFFFTIFNEKVTGRWQFSLNEQILHKHEKKRENTDFYMDFRCTDFYMDFRWCTDFYMDLWVYGLIQIFNFWKHGFLPLSTGNTGGVVYNFVFANLNFVIRMSKKFEKNLILYF